MQKACAKYLGRGAEKRPSWRKIVDTAQVALPPDQAAKVLAVAAGLFCQAKNIARPEGYDGQILQPSWAAAHVQRVTIDMIRADGLDDHLAAHAPPAATPTTPNDIAFCATSSTLANGASGGYTDIDFEALIRGVGHVTLAASSLEWTMSYFTAVICRRRNEETLNQKMARCGHTWEVFDRLVDELSPAIGDGLTALRDDIQRLRDERNQFVRSVWIRLTRIPDVLDNDEIWHPRTDAFRPVNAKELVDLAHRLGRAATELHVLTTALLN
jgi:hypothetical protein